MLLSSSARFVIERLSSSGHRAYVVGGSVRDFYMGKTPSDFDITTDAFPDRIKEVFSDFKTIDTGLKHGTVSVKVGEDIIEITTHRHDGGYHDHRRPDTVTFTKRLEDDLSRRDFTINAMAYNDEVGIVDLFGGIKDLEKGLVRCVGDPEVRFEEDALRILRALRFASVLDFEIEENTKKAIFSKLHLLLFVSRERISEEIRKFVSGKGAERILSEYKDVFCLMFDGIVLRGEFPFDRIESSTLKLALLFYYSPSFEEHLKSLTLPKKERTLLKEVLTLTNSEFKQTRTDIKKLLSSKGEEAVRLFLELQVTLGKLDEAVLSTLSDILASGECVTLSSLDIKGDDLATLSIDKRNIGRLLTTLLDAVIEGKVKNDKDALLEYIASFCS